MKVLAVLFLVIFSAVAGQAFAEDALLQPLTRADCKTARDGRGAKRPMSASSIRNRLGCGQVSASHESRL